MPHMTGLEMMPKPALVDRQNRARAACSSLRYQLPTTSTQPGVIVYSKGLERSRMGMRWLRFCAAAMEMTRET